MEDIIIITFVTLGKYVLRDGISKSDKMLSRQQILSLLSSKNFFKDIHEYSSFNIKLGYCQTGCALFVDLKTKETKFLESNKHKTDTDHIGWKLLDNAETSDEGAAVVPGLISYFQTTLRRFFG